MIRVKAGAGWGAGGRADIKLSSGKQKFPENQLFDNMSIWQVDHHIRSVNQ